MANRWLAFRMLKIYHLRMLDNIDFEVPEFWDALPQHIQKELAKIAVLKFYSDGQLIHSRGDDKPGLSIVKSGAVKVGTYGVNGDFLATAIIGSGHVFGEFTLFAGLPRTHDVSAVGSAEIYQVPKSGFMKLFETHREILQALFVTTLHRSHALLERMDDMRRLPLDVQAAKLIFSIAARVDRGGFIQMRQIELAYMLGVSRVSIGKALKDLEKLKLIELGYGQIAILDFEKLDQWIEKHSAIMRLKSI